MWLADARTTEFTFVSHGAAHLLGWTPEEANAGAATFSTWLHPDRPRPPPGAPPTPPLRPGRRPPPPRPVTRSTSRIASSLGTAPFVGCTRWAGSCMNRSLDSPG